MKDQQGAILPLTLILSIAFLAVIGLMIDVSLWSGAKTDVEHSTDAAALVALERFLETSAFHDDDVDTRLQEAAARASAIVNQNIEYTPARNLMDPSATLSDVKPDASGNNGQIFPGIWHFEAPAPFGAGPDVCEYEFPAGSDTSQSCPCGADTDGNGFAGSGSYGSATGTDWQGPCFEEIGDPSQGAPVNAIRLAYSTGSSGKVSVSGFLKGVSTFFGAPAPEMEVTAQSYAAIKPRRAVFLLDLSESMASDTHNKAVGEPSNQPQIWGGYSHEVRDGQSCPALTDYDDPSDVVCDIACLGSASGSLELTLEYNDALALRCVPANSSVVSFAPTDPCRFNPPYPDFSSNIPVKHREDYGCQTISTGDAVRSEQTFLIDQSAGARPEPLSSALDGINAALLSFQDRAVTADQIAVIGFDSQILPVRVTTDGVDTPALVDVSSSEVDDFITATDTSLSTNKYSKFLFPRTKTTRDGTLTFNASNQSHTDLYLAFNEAADLIENDQLSKSAENMIVLFSDGVTTCVDPAGPNDQDPDCENSLDYHEWGMEDLFRRAQNLLANRDVHIHVFLSGNTVRPHSLVRKGPTPSSCMSDADARGLDFTMVDLNRFLPTSGVDYLPSVAADLSSITWTSMSSTARDEAEAMFVERTASDSWNPINILYQLSRASEGLWIPLRPPCSSSNVATDLLTACNAEASVGDRVFGGDRFGALYDDVEDSFGNTIYSASVDGNGRLLCDTDQRSKQEQVSDAIAKLMNRNPYLLVRPMN